MDWSTILPFILTLGGLILLVLSNNLIGGFNAIAEGTFDKEKSKKGIIKATGILLGLIAGYVAGMMVPDISIGMVNGQTMTMAQAVSAIITGAYGVYGYKFVQKCIEALQLKININPAESGEIDKLSSAQRGS